MSTHPCKQTGYCDDAPSSHDNELITNFKSVNNHDYKNTSVTCYPLTQKIKSVKCQHEATCKFTFKSGETL